MAEEKQTTTIELTNEDKLYIRALSMSIGIMTTIGILRFAIRNTVENSSKATAVYNALTSPGVGPLEVAQGDFEQ